MTDRIEKYTDLTYGVLLLFGIIAVHVIGNSAFFAGLGIGIFIGYIVHVGAEMIEFADLMDEMENVGETIKSVEETSERAVEKVEETVDQVEETKKAVESVEEKTQRVEDAVNGNDH